MKQLQLMKLAAFAVVALVWGAASAAPASAQDATSFEGGRSFGERNGGLMVDRVRARTVDRLGCSGLDGLQDALLAATRAVRPVGGSGDAFVRGFYAGYRDALTDGIEGARSQCSSRRFSDGSYPGELQGALFCGLVNAGADVEAGGFEGYAFEPIYDDWSGSGAVRRDCRASFGREVRSCLGSSHRSLVKVAKKAICR